VALVKNLAIRMAIPAKAMAAIIKTMSDAAPIIIRLDEYKEI
jgi:hypothetical protein